MDHLTKLPNELLHCIATLRGDSTGESSRLLHPKDLASLIRTHSRLHCVVLPVLYAYNRDIDGSTAVIWAAQNGCIDTLERAMAYGLDLDMRRPLRAYARRGIGLWKPTVYHAIEHGHAEVVEWLLGHGAQIDSQAIRFFEGAAHESLTIHTVLELRPLDVALRLTEKGTGSSYTPSHPAERHLGCATRRNQ
ncbi:hypothetical protein BJ170DRAFT_286275 [Xylariales sp. AK1849]|nr:hypothetical protein BJ170DRAFT_286275 [Xylariales sp. AK1849]